MRVGAGNDREHSQLFARLLKQEDWLLAMIGHPCIDGIMHARKCCRAYLLSSHDSCVRPCMQRILVHGARSSRMCTCGMVAAQRVSPVTHSF